MPTHLAQPARFTSLALACVLALGAAGTAAAQTALTQTTGLAGQLLMASPFDDTVGAAITDNSSRDGGESIVRVKSVSLDSFNAAAGVLVGVSGLVQVDSASSMTIFRPPSGGNYDGSGMLRAEWTLQPGLTAFSGLNGLARLVIDGKDEATYNQTVSTWNDLAYSSPATALAGFVGISPLETSITTRLVASKAKSSGTNENRVVVSIDTPLTGALSLQYSYLQHASAGFDANGTTSLNLTVAPGGADFSLRALGDAQHTTHLDLLGVSCLSGACDQAILDLSLQDLAAGQAASFHIGGHSGSATYALLVGDNRQVGAANSQLSQTLSLTVTAVPEPTSLALLLAGLASIGMLAHRRGVASRS